MHFGCRPSHMSEGNCHRGGDSRIEHFPRKEMPLEADGNGNYRAGAGGVQSPHPFHRLTRTQDGVEQGLAGTYGREQGKS